ncbi:MAG: hypothetical protein SEPTF4163_003943 [Sporothrix epigloea]
MAPELRSSAEKKAPAPADPSNPEDQATASGNGSTGSPGTSQVDPLQGFMKYLIERQDEDRERRDEERKRREQREDEERRRQDRRDEALFAAIASLAVNINGQARPTIQPAPSPSPRAETADAADPAATEASVEAAYSAHSSQPAQHAKPTGQTPPQAPASPIVKDENYDEPDNLEEPGSLDEHENLDEPYTSRSRTRGTRGGAAKHPQDNRTFALKWMWKPYVLYARPMPTEHLVRQVFSPLARSTHVEDYPSFDRNKLTVADSAVILEAR